MGVEGVSGMSSSEISDREVVEPVGELVMEAEGDRVGVTGTDSRVGDKSTALEVQLHNACCCLGVEGV